MQELTKILFEVAYVDMNGMINWQHVVDVYWEGSRAWS